jgi:hypothetical protein
LAIDAAFPPPRLSHVHVCPAIDRRLPTAIPSRLLREAKTVGFQKRMISELRVLSEFSWARISWWGWGTARMPADTFSLANLIEIESDDDEQWNASWIDGCDGRLTQKTRPMAIQ